MILARNSITLHHLRDITTVVWYYKLQASTASPPAKPTTATPSGWTTTEPSYTEGSTNSLYVVQKTTFSDGTFEYSDVSLSTSYEAAKIAYNKAVVAQESADAIPATVPGINLSPFFSHDLTDIYDANTNPNGFWMDNGTSYGWTKNTKFTFTKLEDGWLHIHIDNSSGTGIIRNDCCVTRYNPSVKRATKYTFLAEFRNNQSTGAASMADFYLVQQSGSVQFWGQNVSTAPLVHLEGIGGVTVPISEIPSDGSYVFSRFTKYSESEGESSHWTTNEKMVTFTFRANAGAVLDYEIRLSLYEGEYWGPYTPYVVSDTSAIRNAVDALQPELIVGTHGTTATATWTGTSTVLTEIKAGTRIQYKLSSAGASNVTLNLTLKNGTTTGAKNVYFLNTTRLDTQYGINAIIDLIYDGSAWRVLNPYTNSNTVGTYGGAVKAGTNGVKNYSLVMRDTETTWVSLTTTAGTGTSKSRYTGKLYPDNVMYMGSNNAYASGATTGTCYEALGVNLQYSTNCGSTLTSGRAVYLVGTLDSDGLFTLDATWWTQTIPTTADGKTYIYLGLAYSTTNIYLVPDNTLYQYFEGAFRTLREIEEMKAAKVADNYLSADNTGIMVADMTDGTQYTPSNVPSGTKNTFINEDSFQVRDGTDVLASFGETTQIGQDGTNHQIIDSTGLQGINEDGLTVFQIDMDGAVTETFVSSGKRLAFLRSIASGQSKTVTVPLDDFPIINKRVILKVVTLFRTDEGDIVEQHNSIERFTYGTDAQLSKTYGATQYTVTYSASDNTLTLLVQVGDAPARQYTYVELNLMSYYTSAPAPAFLFGSRRSSDNLGAFSGTIGEALSASTRDQFACGRYNYEHTDYAFMVGNGSMEEGDSNALAVTWDGNMMMALDEDAVSGTDAELYSAITSFGWEDDVIVW